ncbi:phosphopantetheine attachment site [Lucifera butyrica]|uniref:Phosphopantetheine attachment site n=1 Tax=Lucifera butyrica TaxID=1351585 RepID=A0A498R9G0_9FIRM|nr:polyketide synthase [Lucifera butyrica]VBB05768.1 phosphopantetheine attachment site [Lucifera butyrica]
MSDNLFDIAIIGMAGRFPGARDIMQFWENVKNGKDCITFFTDAELKEAGVGEEQLKDPGYVKAFGYIEDIEMFDAPFFNITSREAELTDPQQRIFLECAWEAMENAGYVPEKYTGIIGVFGGASSNTYLLHNIARAEGIDTGTYPVMIGNEKDFLCTRVAYKLNLKGPGLTIQTACSTSLVAVHMACQSILNGECDVALAGGVTVRVPQKAGYRYQEGGILSPDGHCRAFDEGARGTVIGNGAGMVVLKSLTKAVKDRDHIYAVIKGTAINNDGAMKVGFTAPSVEGQVKVIQEALLVAGVSPDSVGYLEAHGTGTQLGDPIEIAALRQVFQESTPKKNFCPIGSVKANVGHLDAASGVTGLIKTVWMLDKRLIPPSINFVSPNPKLELDNSPFFINTKLTEWKPTGETLRRAGVSSFGLGGTNAHVVLEEWERREEERQNQAMWSLIPISAGTTESLERVKANYLHYFSENPRIEMDDAAFTLAMGRREFGNRFYCVCKDPADFEAIVGGKETPRSGQGKVEDRERETLFLFPDMERIHKESIREIYESEPVFRESLDQCSKMVGEKFGLSLENRLFGVEPAKETDDREKRLVQFSLQYALAIFFTRLGINAALWAGGAIGKQVTLCVGGEVTLDSAFAAVGDDFTAEKEPEHDNQYIMLDSQEDFKFIDSHLSTNKENRVTVLIMGSHYGSEVLAAHFTNALVLPVLLDEESKDSSRMHLLNTLGHLWVNGVSIDWSVLYRQGGQKRIPLPAYCFDRKRYWIGAPCFDSMVQAAATLGGENRNQAENTKENIDRGYITQRLKDLVMELIGTETVDDTDDIFELCGDSFVALQLNNEIEKQFHLKLPIKNIIENNTVEKLADIIWNLLHSSSAKELAGEDPVVRFQTGGGKTPIFLIHPAGGTVMGYKPLVRYLPQDYPVYGIQYTYKEEKNAIRTIEDIADGYIELIREIQPDGPVILGGHSFGGNAAFEIAVRLQKKGVKVEHLIMFDSHPPLAYYCNEVFSELRFLKAFPLVCAMYFDKTAAAADVEIDNLEGVIRYLKERGWIPWGFDNIQFKEYYHIWRKNHNSLRTHMPKDQYTGSLVFFRAQTMQPKEILERLNIALTEGMDFEEWNKLSPSGLKLFEVPGSHYTMLNEPNVKVIAGVLNKVLVS